MPAVFSDTVARISQGAESEAGKMCSTKLVQPAVQQAPRKSGTVYMWCKPTPWTLLPCSWAAQTGVCCVAAVAELREPSKSRDAVATPSAHSRPRRVWLGMAEANDQRMTQLLESGDFDGLKEALSAAGGMVRQAVRWFR